MPSTQPSYIWFITGTNRGVGLELTRQLLEVPSNTVIAACRSPSKATALQTLQHSAKGTLHIVELEVTDRESVQAAEVEVARLVGDRGIDYLINNVGVNLVQEDQAFSMDIDILQQVFATNVAGTASVSQVFLPLVEKSTKKTIVNISSTYGSVSADFGPLHASYSISKNALSMLTYKQAKERPDLTVVAMCPGWLQTDMGGPNAMNHVSVGVHGVIKTVLSLAPENSGQFRNHEGGFVAW
ncbi:NAD-P-binding protein [Fomes fomentarius]|nr:NAD-P-binding protein [Fomes fomentarius]